MRFYSTRNKEAFYSLKDAAIMGLAPDGGLFMPESIPTVDIEKVMSFETFPEMSAYLAKQFFDHSIDRRYQAIVWGDLKEDEGTIEGTIGRDPNDRLRYKVYEEEDRGKHAVTHYRVLERFGYVTFVECKLETGRTHQIRVHMSHIGHPLFNDERYGGSEIRKGTIYAKYRQFIQNCFELCPRQALHAKTLGFVHPGTRQWLQFDSALPEDMTALIDKWRKYSSNMIEEE